MASATILCKIEALLLKFTIEEKKINQMGIFQHAICWKMPIKHIKHSNMPIKHKSAWTNLPTRMILRPHTPPSNRESFALRC